jgi:hypothetical protein
MGAALVALMDLVDLVTLSSEGAPSLDRFPNHGACAVVSALWGSPTQNVCFSAHFNVTPRGGKLNSSSFASFNLLFLRNVGASPLRTQLS